jgi:diacylglycerol kinase (ATP)
LTEVPERQGRARRAILLVNRKARSGAQPIDRALMILSRGGLEVREVLCDGKTDIPDRIRAEAASVDCVIVGGGDGTLNSAAPALVETGLPLGILPLGTANDLARTLGIEPDPVAAAGIIVAGHVRQIDLGEVNAHLFFNLASIGFSAEHARELTKEAKKRWGMLGYGLAAVRLLTRTRPFRAVIDHEGVTERVRTVQISVGNGRHYGAGMTVESTAEPDDGRLDTYSLEVRHWWHLLRLLPSLRRGTQRTWGDVRAFSATELTVRTSRPRSVNADGELVTTTPARFRILPAAIRVYAPRTRLKIRL